MVDLNSITSVIIPSVNGLHTQQKGRQLTTA